MRKQRRYLEVAGGALAALSLTFVTPATALAAGGTQVQPQAASAETKVESTDLFSNPTSPVKSVPLFGDNGRVITGLNDPLLQKRMEKKLAGIETELEAAGPSVKAPVPDPLDFGSQKPDPEGYGVPKSAETYFGGHTSGAKYQITAPTDTGKSNGTVPAGLERYYGQTVKWGGCADFDPYGGNAYDVAGTECGYVVVPVDYNKTDGDQAAIALLKIPAADPSSKIGTLFIDPGGPGGSGVESVAGIADRLDSGAWKELHAKFDIVGFDPRGVSSSLPMIRCQSSAAFDAQREGSDKLSGAQLDSIQKYNTDECYKNTPKEFNVDGDNFVANVGTINVVRDLDVARSALGDKKLTYLGWSYGTSIGYQYALQFPENIRAIIDDGVVNPYELNPQDLGTDGDDYVGKGGGVSQIEGFQATFNEFLKKCAAEDGFVFSGTKVPCALGTSGDLDEMMKNYQALSQKAWGGTYYEAKSRDGSVRPVSFADFTQGTILTMYNSNYWKYLNYGLSLAKEGDGSFMLRLADAYYSRASDGLYSYMQSAFQTIWCVDHGVTSDGGSAEGAMAYYQKAPFTDPGKDENGEQRGLQPTKDWCTYYKDKGTLPKGQQLKAMPNILVISSTYDSATPYPSGVIGAWAQGATLLTVANASHTAFPKVECAAQIGVKYLTDLVVPTDITGATGVETKDIYSNVITGNECSVHSFRPTPELKDATTPAGTSVEIPASGLVRGQHYKLLVNGEAIGAAPKSAAAGVVNARVAFPAANTVEDKSTDNAATVVADENGTLTLKLVLGKDVPAGVYDTQLVPADPTENDPTVKPAAKLTVTKAEETGPTVPITPAPTDAPEPGNPGDGNDHGDDNAAPKLPNTGAEGVSPIVPLGAVAFLIAGGAVLAARRRRA